MKFAYVLATVAAVSMMMSSCSCNKKDKDAAAEGAATEQQDAQAQAQAPEKTKKQKQIEKGEEPAAEAEELAEGAKEYRGYIKSIDGNDVTLWDGKDAEKLTVLTLENAEGLIEGAPIVVYYTPKAEGEGIKLAAAQDRAMAIAKDYRLLLGKWTTEDQKITYELRRRGVAKNVQENQNVNFKGWLLHNDTIEFAMTSAAAPDVRFYDDGWYVESVDETSLILTKQDAARLEMKRVDSNLD
ncbi:MAG: hypothetical protein II951_12835 [Bacteroidales bacterium]|nr:hypothetical protein [Bacteroidales bacterium]